MILFWVRCVFLRCRLSVKSRGLYGTHGCHAAVKIKIFLAPFFSQRGVLPNAATPVLTAHGQDRVTPHDRSAACGQAASKALVCCREGKGRDGQI